MKLILASGSAQRIKILQELGLTFRAIPADIDEHHDGLKKPHAIARSIALRKALEVAKSHPNDWVIGCDTLVSLSNGQISEKPLSRCEARLTLKTYQNSHCDVYSGLALIHHKKQSLFNGYEKTRIHFSNFSDESIEQYLDSGAWKGRSGAMTIEDNVGWIKSMEGEYWNVVGLPVNLLKKQLKIRELV